MRTNARRRRCKECKELFTPKYSTLQNACSPMCAISYSKRRDAEKKQENDALLTKMEKEKKNRSGLTTLLESVKKVCHEYIRERDKGEPCISCGTQWHKDFQAGHFFKAELYSGLRFNEYNINGQCVQCNIRLEGNLNPYSINLPQRIEQSNYEALNTQAKEYKQSVFKWNREDLKAIRNYFKQKLKQLKDERN